MPSVPGACEWQSACIVLASSTSLYDQRDLLAQALPCSLIDAKPAPSSSPRPHDVDKDAEHKSKWMGTQKQLHFSLLPERTCHAYYRMKVCRSFD